MYDYLCKPHWLDFTSLKGQECTVTHISLIDVGDLRWGIHQIFEGREDGEEPFRYELKVAVSHVVHKIDVSNVAKKAAV